MIFKSLSFVLCVTVIITYPLILIFIKKFIISQLKISSESGIGIIITILMVILEIAPAIIVVVTRKESLYSLGITRINILKSLFVGFISYFLYFAFMVIMKQYIFPFPPNSIFSYHRSNRS